MAHYTNPTVDNVRNVYKNALVETRSDADGVVIEFDYNGSARQVVPVELTERSVEGYVQTDKGDDSGLHDDNDAPYKRFSASRMNNLKVIVAE